MRTLRLTLASRVSRLAHGLAWLSLWLGRGEAYPGRLTALMVLGFAFVGGADTTVASGAAVAVQRWAEDVWLELPERIFWGPYLQEDVNAIIQVKKELEKDPGEKITFVLARQLANAAVAGDAALETNEEAITTYSDSLTLEQYRNAVRLAGKMSEKRTAYSQRMLAKQLLKDWLAAPTTAVYGGLATSTATIASGDYLTLALVTKAKVKARKASPQIFPVSIEGGDYFLLVIAPDVLNDLKVFDPAFAQAQREAQIRGEKNPLFTGAEAIWDGVVIRSSTRVPLTTNWGAGANLTGAENLFCGRQVACFGWGAKPSWVEQAFDYGNKTGFAIGAIYQIKKAVFNAVDNGLVGIRTFRSNI
jgi:N4-gp56 family major capsid protein